MSVGAERPLLFLRGRVICDIPVSPHDAVRGHRAAKVPERSPVKEYTSTASTSAGSIVVADRLGIGFPSR